MKTIALVLVLAAVCIAEPLRLTNNCGGRRTRCSSSLSEGSAENAEVTNNCKRGSRCKTKVRDQPSEYYDGPGDYNYNYNYGTYNIYNDCSRGARCETNAGGKKKRDLVAALKSFPK